MHLEKIITLANRKVATQFNVMERSLRKSGCQLQLYVIPYDDDRFDLPENACWFEDADFFEYLKRNHVPNLARKYICLTQQNYQFLDTDIVVLKNPADVYGRSSGFVASCGHWHSQQQTFTSHTLPILKRRSTLWQKYCFNTGQFACDRVLYTIEELKDKCSQPGYKEACIEFKETKHEQPGLNALVSGSGVEMQNLTLPPISMESTWAGDYQNDFSAFWTDSAKKPYIIHWAGLTIDGSRNIDNLFFSFLTEEERTEWNQGISAVLPKQHSPLVKSLSKMKNTIKGFVANINY